MFANTPFARRCRERIARRLPLLSIYPHVKTSQGSLRYLSMAQATWSRTIITARTPSRPAGTCWTGAFFWGCPVWRLIDFRSDGIGYSGGFFSSVKFRRSMTYLRRAFFQTGAAISSHCADTSPLEQFVLCMRDIN